MQIKGCGYTLFTKTSNGSVLTPGASGKETTCQGRRRTKDVGSIPVWGRFPGGGNGNPLQYSCLENLMDRGAWWATVHGVVQSQTQYDPGKTTLLASLSGGALLDMLDEFRAVG